MKRTLSCLLVLTLVLSLFAFSASAAGRTIITTPTGYTSASDVDYVTCNQSGKTVVVNWGARGEDCLFLSAYAEDYYTGSYTYETLSAHTGGSSQTNAPNSALYSALKAMMTQKHTYIISYQDTRPFYQYTDCVSNDYGKLSSFYSGKIVNGTWDNGKTYNREHTWPNSKGLNGDDENDIMMLRPTIATENGSRGNKAYGESSGFFDPGVDVRGDCARIALYVYTRWGNTGKMWGSSGVMESLEILLKWMEEDPVDTWEMGRNDAVQSITGTRNVFIDYPELAWLLFGGEVPADMTTPSRGTGSSEAVCKHSSTEIRSKKDATCTENGYTGDTYCSDCGAQIASGAKISATGHQHTELRDEKQPTCTEDGYSGDTYCKDCGSRTETGSTISATGHTDANRDNLCDSCTTVINPVTEETVPPITESTVTTVPATEGIITTVPATSPATVPSEDIPAMSTGSDSVNSSPAVWIVIGVVILLAVGITAFIITKKKKATE